MPFRQTPYLHDNLGLLRSAGAPQDEREESEEDDEGEGKDREVAAASDPFGVLRVCQQAFLLDDVALLPWFTSVGAGTID